MASCPDQRSLAERTTDHPARLFDLWASGAQVTTAQAIVTVPAIKESAQVDLLSQTLAGVRSHSSSKERT